jgi:DNA polymerase-4
MATALRLCPEAVRVSPRFDRYREMSRRVMDIFHDATPLVEQISLDEAFLDVSDAARPAEEIAAALKRRVHDELGLTVSIGVASSKSVAKIASDFDKPDGLTVVPTGGERAFLAPLPVRSLWGVGPKTAESLAAESVTTVGELAAKSEEWAQSRYGQRGLYLLRLARGEDTSPVTVKHETKSVSSETTFPRDIFSGHELEAALRDLAEHTARRLKRAGLRGKTLKLKLRLADFTTFTRQTTRAGATNDADVIFEEASRLLGKEMREGRRFRLLGVGVSGFVSKEASVAQPSLFSDL